MKEVTQSEFVAAMMDNLSDLVIMGKDCGYYPAYTALWRKKSTMELFAATTRDGYWLVAE